MVLPNRIVKFDRSHRWGLFPALGLGYIVSNEPFWQPLENVLPGFKLKYSWGKVGNDQIAGAADRFFFLSDIGSGGGYRWGRDFNSNYGDSTSAAMPPVNTEIAVKQNVGFELDVFKETCVKVIIGVFLREQTTDISGTSQHAATMGLTSNVYGTLAEEKSVRLWTGPLI